MSRSFSERKTQGNCLEICAATHKSESSKGNSHTPFQLKSYHFPAAAILMLASAGRCKIKLHIYFKLSIPGLKVAPASIVEALVFKSLLSIKHKCNTGGTSSATNTLKVWE